MLFKHVALYWLLPGPQGDDPLIHSLPFSGLNKQPQYVTNTGVHCITALFSDSAMVGLRSTFV